MTLWLEEDRWIPVSDGMPDSDVVVLVWVRHDDGHEFPWLALWTGRAWLYTDKRKAIGHAVVAWKHIVPPRDAAEGAQMLLSVTRKGTDDLLAMARAVSALLENDSVQWLDPDPYPERCTGCGKGRGGCTQQCPWRRLREIVEGK